MSSSLSYRPVPIPVTGALRQCDAYLCYTSVMIKCGRVDDFKAQQNFSKFSFKSTRSYILPLEVKLFQVLFNFSISHSSDLKVTRVNFVKLITSRSLLSTRVSFDYLKKFYHFHSSKCFTTRVIGISITSSVSLPLELTLHFFYQNLSFTSNITRVTLK